MLVIGIYTWKGRSLYLSCLPEFLGEPGNMKIILKNSWLIFSWKPLAQREHYYFMLKQDPGTGPRGCIDIKMLSYRNRNSHHKDKTVSRPSYLYNGNPYTWNEQLYVEAGPRIWYIPLLLRLHAGLYSVLSSNAGARLCLLLILDDCSATSGSTKNHTCQSTPPRSIMAGVALNNAKALHRVAQLNLTHWMQNHSMFCNSGNACGPRS